METAFLLMAVLSLVLTSVFYLLVIGLVKAGYVYLQEYYADEKKKPSVLLKIPPKVITVLCVLSFIGLVL